MKFIPAFFDLVAILTFSHEKRYIFRRVRSVESGPIMSQEHATALPPIPFTEHDYTAMRHEDVRSAKTIAFLTCGIFGIGLVLYTVVLITVFSQTLIYASR